MVYGDNVLGRSIREVVFEKRDKSEHEWNQSRIREGVRGFMDGLPALEAALDREPFLAGTQPTLAECVLFPRFALALANDVEVPEEFPFIRQWFGRMAAHPAFVSASPERFRNFLFDLT